MNYYTPYKSFTRFLLSACFLALTFFYLTSTKAEAQTKTSSWLGGISSDWNTAGNWTNGVPDGNTAVIIGGNAYGSTPTTYIPTLQENYAVTVFSLTITSTGALKFPVRLNVANTSRLFSIKENVNLTGSGELLNYGTVISLGGNWNNSGTYTESIFNNYYPAVDFTGTGKTVGGTSSNVFNHFTCSGNITLTAPVTLTPLGTVLSKFEVKGVLDPGLHKVTFTTTPADGFVVAPNATIKVKAPTYGENYSLQPTTLYVNSTIDYAATNGTQTVFPRAYGILKISGGGIKQLEANTTVSNISAVTQLLVEAGTLDLKTFSLNRTSSGTDVTGGTLTVANGATLRIGGTGTFPTGYNTRNVGSTSTVEYYGTAQTVTNEAYGNLTLNGSDTKTLPASTLSIAGKLLGAGSASFTANGDLNVTGDLELSGTSSFNGSTYTHTIGGNWTDNASFISSASTIVLNGAGKQINRTVAGNAPFNNLTISGGPITVAASSVVVSGDLTTTGAGTLTHSSGTFTMNGAAGIIAGANMTFQNLEIDGANVTTSSSFTVNAFLRVYASKKLTASGGTITMNGSAGQIIVPGTLIFHAVNIQGTITTNNSFTVNSNFSGTGKLTASGGTVTFAGTSTFGGNHDLYSVTIASGKSLTMVANSNMGVANLLTTTGTLNTSSNKPNTITYNGTAAQTVLGREYNNISFDKTGTKSAGGALTITGNVNVLSGSNFNGSSHTHTLSGNWVNNGTFTASTSTVNFISASDVTITGTTTFNTLSITKASASNSVTLNNNITASTLALTTGSLRTGSNKITVTNTRTGNGWIYGTITRQHSFTSGTTYAFAAPNNIISLTSATGVTSITVTNTSGVVSSFANGSAVNRRYEVSIAPTGTYAGNLQLQYDDADLNGNSEAGLQLYYAATSSGPWSAKGATDRNATDNWVKNSTLTNVAGNWTMAEVASIIRWTGAVSTLWSTAGNWLEVGSNTAKVPGVLDIVELGFTSSVTNQPELTTVQSVKAIQFTGAGTPISLNFNGGTLTVSGNIAANGTGSTTVHAIKVNSGTLTVGGSLTLNDGSTGNNINISTTTGTIDVTGDLNHAGTSTITLSSGTFKLRGNYNLTTLHTNFSGGASSFSYLGSNTQKIGSVYYPNLTIDKSAGIAELLSPATGYVGNLTITNGAVSIPGGSYIILGNLTHNGGSLSVGSSSIEVQKTWTKTSGASFDAGTSTVTFTGTSTQSIPAATFNHLTINKGASSNISLAGTVTVNADLTAQSGLLNLGTNTINRSAIGGSFTMGSAAKLTLTGSNFPSGYATTTLDPASTVTFQGTTAQNIPGATYGNLTFLNGGTNAKRLQNDVTVAGSLTINSGATLNGNSQTISLLGDFIQNGSFVAGPTNTDGTLLLSDNGGIQKLLSGNITLNNLLLEQNANYKVINGDILIKGSFTNNGNLDAVDRKATFEGDFLNAGALKSSGSAMFSGTRLQKIQLQAPIQGSIPHPSIPNVTIPPAVEFNGTIAPVLTSSTTPTFGKLTINNTDPLGIKASVGWVVNLDFNVSAGAKFVGGPYTHSFYTAINNSGTIESEGTIDFSPTALAGLAAYPLNFGTSPTAFQSTGTLYIGGTEVVALAGVVPSSLNHLEIANTHASGISTQQISETLPLHGSVWNLTGNLSVANGARFNAGGGTSYIIGGNLIDNGTLNGASGNFTLTNTVGQANNPVTIATIEGTGTTTFGNLTIGTQAHVKLNKDIDILENFTHQGNSFIATEADINFIGASPSTISASETTSLALGGIKITKTAPEVTTTLGTNITDIRTLEIASGLMDIGTYSLTVARPDTASKTKATLTIANTGSLKIGGTSSLPPFEVFQLAEASTVTYYGSDQLMESIQYGHLQALNTGVKTFKPGVVKIAGNFTKAIEATVVTPATIEYNGTGAQEIMALNYQNLTLTAGGTKTFAQGVTGVSVALTVPEGTNIDAISNAGTIEYNGSAGQQVAAINYHNLTISNTGIKTFKDNIGIAAAFTIAPGATADLLTYENTINFNSALEQNIPVLSYKNLSASAAGIKTLQGNITVEKKLLVTAGEIRTANHKITLGETSGTISETETSFVTGTVETKRTLTGTEENFGGLGITITNAATGSTTVSRLTGKTVGPNGTSVKRSFTFNPTGTNTGLKATAKINYFTHELNSIPEDKLAFYTSSNGTNWVLQPKNRTTINTADNTASLSEVNSLNQFALGNEEVPLPVSYISFTGKTHPDGVLLDWKTATEKDNDYFEVERSTDGKRFKEIGRVKGNGTTNVELSYSFIDATPATGTVYYRLRQVDYDGKSEHSKIISVKAKVEKAAVVVQLFPNPTTDGVQLNFSGIASGEVVVRIFSLNGTLVKTEQVQIGSAEKIDLTLVPAGTYLFKISGPDLDMVLRVVKQ